ncbi:MAG: hypothetical protein NT001_02380 [Candidatus Woesearchaeota archaeon]|nr:hypothetical protein [Candidatus Woesearchaeota archaeon]
MDHMNLNFPKLTENDKTVLKKIIDCKRIPDSDIAKTMKLSPQAVFKIRNKLEECSIIQIVYSEADGSYKFNGLVTSSIYDIEAEKSGYALNPGNYPVNKGVTAGVTTSNQDVLLTQSS